MCILLNDCYILGRVISLVVSDHSKVRTERNLYLRSGMVDMHRSSYCGVNCEKCRVYIGTMTDDDNIKQEIANEWGLLYKRDFKKADMNCKGCKSDIHFSLCASCDITSCNVDRGINNCEDCDIYPCERIKRFFNFHKNNATTNEFE